jgi:hypothetical protein
MPDKEVTYLRLPPVLKERVQAYAAARDEALTEAAADLLAFGLDLPEVQAQLSKATARMSDLERQLALQQAKASFDRSRLHAFEQQVGQLNQWLRVPIAVCQDCQQVATLLDVVMGRCPSDASTASAGYELTPPYQGHSPIDVLRAMAGLIGAVTIIAAGGKTPQGHID